MTPTQTKPVRILAIDPTTKGFGFAVLEHPLRLVAWGLAHVSGEKRSGATARFEALLDEYRPDAVVLEDTAAPGARRQPRVKDLLAAIANVARERGLAVESVARLAVLKCFSSADEQATKTSIARALAVAYPELAGSVPARRKAWQSQDERISIFDALANAVTYLSG